MFNWYRGQIKEFGLVDATRVFLRVGWSRAKASLQNRLLPANRACPCCGWTGRRFHDYIELGYSVPDSVCPTCDSCPRHRAFYLWLQHSYPLAEKRGTALVFAPERALAAHWAGARGLRVVRVDVVGARGVDLLADLTRLPFAADSIALVWCHHVLEHIEDDRAAIRELARVLLPETGELIVSVPMESGPTTREFGFANPRQTGHWRIYGDDFAARLSAGGLTVQALAHDPPPDERRKYGILPEKFYICRKASAAASDLAA